jgi:endonuclease/exonuclease/phosphatase family metal-dependent hydrolase
VFHFNVLTLNVHMGFGLFGRRFVLRELRDAIHRVAADIVFLQEVGETTHHRSEETGPQYEFLADTVWPQYAYGRNTVIPHGHLGNALLSKFPILEHRNRDISVPGHEPRGLLHALLDLPGTGITLHAICVHLGLRESHRRTQLALLCAIVRDEIPADAPLVVAGDFNDWRRRGHPLLTRCGLREVFEAAQGRLARTFPARWPLLPVDRIYVRNLETGVPEVLHAAPWSGLSDHAPLLARLHG